MPKTKKTNDSKKAPSAGTLRRYEHATVTAGLYLDEARAAVATAIMALENRSGVHDVRDMLHAAVLVNINTARLALKVRASNRAGE